MSDKLKLLSNIVFFLCFSCSQKKYFHTEISCPDKPAILVRYTRIDDVKISIVKANEMKKKLETSEDYTVIKTPSGLSLMISGVSPENMYKCTLREIPVIRPDKNITKYD